MSHYRARRNVVASVATVTESDVVGRSITRQAYGIQHRLCSAPDQRVTSPAPRGRGLARVPVPSPPRAGTDADNGRTLVVAAPDARWREGTVAPATDAPPSLGRVIVEPSTFALSPSWAAMLQLRATHDSAPADRRSGVSTRLRPARLPIAGDVPLPRPPPKGPVLRVRVGALRRPPPVPRAVRTRTQLVRHRAPALCNPTFPAAAHL